MRCTRFVADSILPLVLAFTLATAQPRAVAAQGAWTGDFGIPSFDGTTSACAIYNGAYVVAGEFQWAGGKRASNVAMWTGSQWTEPGGGLEAPVTRLAVWNSRLLAATSSASAGSPVQQFDGDSWRPLGSDLYGSATALLVAGGTVYAAGVFYMPGATNGYRVVRWSGSSWELVGGEFDGHVNSLAFWQGELYAGGRFLNGDAGFLGRIARWDGAHWVTVGGAAGGTGVGGDHVAALVVWKDQLIAGGTFRSVGGVDANGIAAWNGSAWSAMADTPDDNLVTDLEPEGNTLHVAGVLQSRGRWAAGLVAFDGQAWAPASTYPNWSISDVATSNGALIAVGGQSSLVTGDFFSSTWTGTRDVLVRDPTWHDLVAWQPTMRGLRGPGWTEVAALHVHDGTLFAGGYFLEAANPPEWTPTGGIARWVDDRWLAVPGNLFGWVQTMTSWNGLLVAGGATLSTGSGYSSVVGWNGSEWSSIAGPIGGPNLNPLNGWVSALEDWQGSLVAGGTFGPHSVMVNRGAGWEALGASLQAPSPVSTSVRALASFAGELYVGGEGLALPAGLRSIARWNGSAWIEVPGLPPQSVACMRSRVDGLWVGLAAGWGPSGASSSVWRWNGTTWTDMGLTAFGVFDLTELDGDVWAVGVGPRADGVSTVERLHHGAWTRVPNAPQSIVLTAEPLGNELFVGGHFTRVGGQPAEALARWSPQAPAPGHSSIVLNAGPNPATDHVRFRFALARPGHVRLTIHDLGGALVAWPVNEYTTPGTHERSWQLPAGRAMRAGVYFAKLTTPDGEARTRVVLVR